MLLMDEVNAVLHEHGKPAMQTALQRAVPFVLDRAAQTVVESLASDAEKISAAARIGCYFFPAACVWIEHEEPLGRFGMLYLSGAANADGDGDLTKGQLLTYMRHHGHQKIVTIGGTVDLLRPNPIHQWPLAIDSSNRLDVRRSIAIALDPSQLEPQESQALTGWLLATLALLNSPKLVRFNDIARSRLNAKRRKVNKPALLDHKVVTIDLSAREVLAERKDQDGLRRAMHFVRAHLRIVQGEIVLVRPHWRGDPALGIVRPKYRLTSKD